MKVKNIGAYFIFLIVFILLYLFLFKPEIFHKITEYKGPGGPFVHPPSY